MNRENQIIIYTSPENHTEVTVKMQDNTVWLTLNQIAEFFGRDKSVISRHFRAIFSSGELVQEESVAKNATVQIEGKKEVIRQIEYYNLDAIISVGYRVNSTRATHFRQWATTRLREYLVQGYTLDRSRLDEIGHTIQMLVHTGQGIANTTDILDIISRYTQSFLLLEKYDTGDLADTGDIDITYTIGYIEAKEAIRTLSEHLVYSEGSGHLFGHEKDKSFEGILASVVCTFDGVYLYPTIEEQAAHLLYFIIKDHPFSDGNKRIGAFLFIWFLEKNKHRYKKNGEIKINDTGLATLALLVAASPPKEKNIMIKLIISLINT